MRLTINVAAQLHANALFTRTPNLQMPRSLAYDQEQRKETAVMGGTVVEFSCNALRHKRPTWSEKCLPWRLDAFLVPGVRGDGWQIGGGHG